MKRCLKKLFEMEQIRFIVVGGLNTIIGTSVMFLAYYCGLGYWISSALNYIVGSIFSYFANKFFTFKVKKQDRKELYRFVVNIVICYFIAYGVAKPIINHFARNIMWDIALIEQISMMLGMCIFVVINYLGQKFYVFKVNDVKKGEDTDE